MKNKLSYHSGFYFFVIAVMLILSACKTMQPDKEKDVKPIPKSYNPGPVTDSTNLANLSWQDFFTDPYLLELIKEGLQNNLDMLQVAQRIEIAKANLNFSRNMLLPSVDIFGSAGQNRYGNYTMDGVGNFDTNFSKNITDEQKMSADLPDFHTGLRMQWEIDIWKKLRNRKKASYARYLASVEGKNLLMTNLVTKIATLYYELVSFDYSLYYIKETNVLLENALSIIEAQKETGLANELAVQQFEAALLNTRAYEKTIDQNIIFTENTINYLLGRYPQTIQRTNNVFSIDIPWTIRTGLPSQLLTNRPDVKQAEYELVASKADLQAARAAFYPSLSINGMGGFKSFNINYFINPQAMVYSIIGGLSAPLINRNAIKTQFKNANAKQIESYYHYQSAIINGYTEVYNQVVYVKNAEEIIILKKKESDVLSEAVESSNFLFLSGMANYIEVLLAQKNSLKSKIELSEAKKAQLNAYVYLYKALGGGWK